MTLDVFRVDVVDVDLDAALNTCVDQRFVQRLIRIQQLHVLADHGDADRLQRVQLGIEYLDPLRQIRRLSF